MKKDTQIMHLGRHPEHYSGAVNPPIISSSTVIYDSRDAYHAAGKGESIYPASAMGDSTDFSYSTGGTPTSYALQEALRELEHGAGCVLTSSGLSAITLTLHSVLRSGDHILMVDTVYGPTRRYCNKVLRNNGIEVEYYDPYIDGDIAGLIRDNTKMIFMESPGSLTFEVQDVPSICVVAKERGVLTVIDNSWATPLFFTPIDHGVDIVIQAVTKYIGGHSDFVMGAVIAKEAAMSKKILEGAKYFGEAPNPFACYLALRGLRTLPIRMQRHNAVVQQIIAEVEKHPKVQTLLCPASKNSPDYDRWSSQFSGAASLFSVVLDKKYDDAALARCMDQCEIFAVGASWGGYESLVLDFDVSSSRTATDPSFEGSCIRFYLGLEDPGDLLTDIEKALDRL